MKSKICTKCKKEYPATPEYFHKNRSSKDRLDTRCKTCKTLAATEYRKNNPETYRKWRKANPKKRREAYYKYNYGITLADYCQLLRQQKGVCAICGEPETVILRGKLLNLAVDHDHETDKVRGLLCNKCNIKLGQFEVARSFAPQALIYLNRERYEK